MSLRRILSTLLLTLSLCLCLVSVAAGENQVNISIRPCTDNNQPITALPHVSDVFNVDIDIKNNTHKGVYGMQLLLRFNPEYLEPMDTMELSSLWEGQFIAKNIINTHQGEAFFVATYVGESEGIKGEQSIARLRFKVKKATQEQMIIAIITGSAATGTALSDKDGNSIPWQTQDCILLGNYTPSTKEGSSNDGSSHHSDSSNYEAMTQNRIIYGKTQIKDLIVNDQLILKTDEQQVAVTLEALEYLLSNSYNDAFPLRIVSPYATVNISRDALIDFCANSEAEELEIYLRLAAGFVAPSQMITSGSPVQMVSNLTDRVQVDFPFNPEELNTSSKYWGCWYQSQNMEAFLPGSLQVDAHGTQWLKLTIPSNFVVQKVVYTPKFSDIENHWARPQLEFLAFQGIIRGDARGAVLPNQTITRAEFACMLARALHLEAKENMSLANFKDVPAEAWYSQDIRLAYEAGIISGVNQNHLAPQQLITREQMAVMLARAYQYICKQELQGANTQFKDSDLISDWAAPAVGGCVKQGYIAGNDVSCFEPKLPATRAQATVMLYQLLNSEEVKSCLGNNWC